MDPLTNFDGSVPLFPLPGATLFPHVVQPYHMFEPRYCQLAENVLNENQLIAIGILKPDHPNAYNTKTAPVFDSVCIGHVTSGEKLIDGRYNLVVNGLSRAKIVNEPATETLYRSVDVQLVADHIDGISEESDARKRRDLIDIFEKASPKIASHPAIRKTLESVLPLGVLCDFIAHVSELDSTASAAILGERCVSQRLSLVRSWLCSSCPDLDDQTPFPPEFSSN